MVQAFFGLLEIDSENSAITIDGNAVNTAAGNFYVWSSESAESYIADLTGLLTTHHGATVTCTITAGVVTLSAAATFTITGWTNREVLGFTTDLTGNNSYTATKRIKYSWFPSTDASSSLATISRQGVPSAIISQAVAPDGTVYTSKWGSLITQELVYQYLPQADVWDAASDNRSYEEFWLSTVSEGRGFIFAPYYGTENTVHQYVADLTEAEMLAKRQIAGTDTYWEVTMKLRGV